MSKAKALADLQSDMPVIKENATNPHYGNSYATFDQILIKIKPVLKKYGAALIHQISENEVKTTILVGDHEWSSVFKLPQGENNPQKIGSAISYGKRYNTAGLLNLTISDEDDDGNKGAESAAQSHKPQQPQESDHQIKTKNFDRDLKAAVKNSNLQTLQAMAGYWKAFESEQPEMLQRIGAAIDEVKAGAA